MKTLSRILIALVIVAAALTWTACTSDGYTGTTSVYVGYGYGGYGGYGPGFGYGWGGGYHPPPVVIGPPVGAGPPVAMPF